MRALPAIYEQGRILFPFDYPEYEGPVSVLVVFPCPEDQFSYENQDHYNDDLPW